MMFLIGDYKTPNEELYSNIQKVYNVYYKPVTEYKNMKEPYKTKFFEGLRSVVLAGGDKVEFRDTYVLYLTKKPV